MTKRRGRGDGTIRERNDGRWEGRIELGYGPTGNRRQKSVFGRTRREVVAKMRAEQQRLDSGLPPTDGRRRRARLPPVVVREGPAGHRECRQRGHLPAAAPALCHPECRELAPN